MELILGIAGLVFFAKIVLHIYLISRTDEDFDYPREFVTLNPSVALKWSKKFSLPSFENVPEKYRVLKTSINVLYALAIVGLIVFLIFMTFLKQKN